MDIVFVIVGIILLTTGKLPINGHTYLQGDRVRGIGICLLAPGLMSFVLGFVLGILGLARLALVLQCLVWLGAILVLAGAVYAASTFLSVPDTEIFDSWHRLANLPAYMSLWQAARFLRTTSEQVQKLVDTNALTLSAAGQVTRRSLAAVYARRYAHIYMLNKQTGPALTLLQTAVNAQTQDPLLYFLYAEACYLRGDLNKAEQYRQKAASFDLAYARHTYLLWQPFANDYQALSGFALLNHYYPLSMLVSLAVPFVVLAVLCMALFTRAVIVPAATAVSAASTSTAATTLTRQANMTASQDQMLYETRVALEATQYYQAKLADTQTLIAVATRARATVILGTVIAQTATPFNTGVLPGQLVIAGSQKLKNDQWGPAQLYVVSLANNTTRPIPGPSRYEQALSSDGKRLAIWSAPCTLTIVGLDKASIARSFTLGCDQWHGLSWSSDNTQLAFFANGGQQTPFGLYTLNLGAATPVPQHITNLQGDAVAWLADGKHLAADLGSDTEIIDVDSGLMTEQTGAGWVWSPDGQYRAQQVGGQITVENLANHSLKHFSAWPTSRLVWSPDNTYLAFLGNFGIPMGNASTGGPIQYLYIVDVKRNMCCAVLSNIANIYFVNETNFSWGDIP